MDGELYLRLLLEECLADPSRTEFHQAAIALLAVGAVPAETAQDLVTDFELARQLRQDDAALGVGHHFFPRRHVNAWRPSREPAGLPSVPIAVGPATIEYPDGPLTLSWITAGRGAALHGALALDPDRSPPTIGRIALSQGPRRPRPVPTVNQPFLHPVARPEPWSDLRVVDDNGTVYAFGMGGGSSQTETTYTFDIELDPEPPVTIRWFEITGPGQPPVRLPVVAPAAAPYPSPAAKTRSRAELYLLHELNCAVVSMMMTGSGPWIGREWPADTGVTAETFVGAGVLPAADPLVYQAKLVGEGDLRHPALDDRLRSALRPPTEETDDRGDRVWPVGIAVSGAGYSLRVDVVTHTPAETCLVGRLQPGVVPDFVPVVLAARDDREQWYLVQTSNSRGGTDLELSFEWRLYPTLDPAATELALVVTGTDGETEIPVALS